MDAPTGQGQVERMNHTIKGCLRKLMSAEPGTSWEDHLTGTLIAVRMFPTKVHGYSPFEIAYKQEPALPSLVVPPEPATL